MSVDVVGLARDLIRCPSVTPAEGGALDLLSGVLGDLGFSCRRLPFQAPGTDRVDNLYAHLGGDGPHYAFAGHTDVVPPGRPESWTVDPFGGDIIGDHLYGRGAVDMKGGIAAFVAALADRLASRPITGSVSLIITGDEEGPSVNGTLPMLQALAAEGVRWDGCLVGEPTNPTRLGDMIKIGRRGSLKGRLTVFGTQGHTAYPHLADNAAHRLVALLHAITAAPMDQATDHFPASTLQVSTIDIGNDAANVIPARARAAFDIRFNDRHDGAGVEAWLRERFAEVGGDWELDCTVSGESFLTPPGPFTDLLAASVTKVTGRTPELSTTGGTSDARFIKDYCPVAEFGLVGQTMHKADERVALADLRDLTAIYRHLLDGWFP